MNRISVFILFIFCCLSACRELVEDEFEPFGPRPVVNSIIQKDSLIKVHISLARELGDKPLPKVENATIELFEEGKYLETLSYSDGGIYVSSTFARSNITYNMRISILGFDTFNAKCKIPEEPTILKIRHIENAGINAEGWTYPAIKVRFETEPNQLKYYEIIVNCYDESGALIPGFHTVVDPVLQNEGISQALFNNELIQKDTYDIHINYSTGSYEAEGNMNLYPLIVELRAVDYNYYMYQKQRYLYEIGRYPEYSISRQTAFQLYSNIEDALGIFAGFAAVKSDTIYPIYYNR